MGEVKRTRVAGTAAGCVKVARRAWWVNQQPLGAAVGRRLRLRLVERTGGASRLGGVDGLVGAEVVCNQLSATDNTPSPRDRLRSTTYINPKK
jgi:hypothetical protein